MTYTFDIMADLDGVFNNWVDPFYPYLCGVHGITEPTEWRIWHHYRNHDISDEDFVATLNKFAEEGLFTANPPFPGTVEQLKLLVEAGHRIHVVTDRPAAAHDDTEKWLNDHQFPHDTLSFSRDKTVFKQYGPGPYFAIDDRVENVQSLRDAGVNAFLLTWPWNEDSALPRVESVEVFRETVELFSDFAENCGLPSR